MLAWPLARRVAGDSGAVSSPYWRVVEAGLFIWIAGPGGSVRGYWKWLLHPDPSLHLDLLLDVGQLLLEPVVAPVLELERLLGRQPLLLLDPGGGDGPADPGGGPDPSPRAGWISTLLLESLRKQCNHPAHGPDPERVDELLLQLPVAVRTVVGGGGGPLGPRGCRPGAGPPVVLRVTKAWLPRGRGGQRLRHRDVAQLQGWWSRAEPNGVALPAAFPHPTQAGHQQRARPAAAAAASEAQSVHHPTKPRCEAAGPKRFRKEGRRWGALLGHEVIEERRRGGALLRR